MNSNEINDQKDGTNGVALPFISFDQTDSRNNLCLNPLEFHINDQAAAVISKIQGKIGVVSVAGLYRTGKSYLLNRILLGRSSGFGVGPTINPCTKGLWLWSEPIPGTTPNGDPISVLIVDTEGLGAFDETQNHDVRIFTLAILLSSYFIYNSMGSIDENSLNQLSLVVNLTKNIQLKQSAICADDVDPEEYSALFPSFMWVVRDFALQLSDENNHSITPKEYLERALLEQKGFSDSVSQKNRIRRLLKQFFSDRDCCTMIRPLANESELQDLVNREVGDLRLEFQDQVKVLRRKVLGKIKPKTLKGRELSGNLLVGLAKQYVAAINQGAVPNIETAWTYICQIESQKALVEACKLFCAVIKDTIQMPCTEEELRTVFTQAKQQSKKLYKQIALGKEAPELKITLGENIAASKQRIIEQNKIECEKQMTVFLQETYAPLGHMLNKNQLESFQQFKDSLIDFQDHCEENGPLGPSSLRSQIIQDYCYRSLVQGAEYFSQSLQSDYNVLQAVHGEKIKHFEVQIQEAKQSLKQERDDLESKLRRSELARADLHTQNLVSEQSLTNFRQERIVQEELMVANHAKEKGALIKQLEASEIECQQRRESLTLAQRQLLQSQSEADKQIALLNQKNDFMAQTCLAKDIVIKQLSQDFKQAQQTFNTDIKDLAQTYDKRLSEVYVQNEELTEKISELQQQNTSLEQTLISSQQQRQDAEQNLRAQIGQAKAQLKSAEEKLESLGEDSRERVQQLESQLASLKSQADSEVAQIRGEVAERANTRVTELEKELAIMTQKLQFAKVQNDDLNAQLFDSKCTQESIMKTVQQKLLEATTGKDEALAMLQQMKEAHSADLEELTINFDVSLVKAEERLEKMVEERTDIQLNSKLESADLKKELNLALTALKQAEELRKDAVNQLREQDFKQTNILEQEKIHAQDIIQGLEDQLEKAQADAETATKLLQEQAEQSLAELKSVYDLERLRLEARLNEEKERSSKKFVQIQQEYETRIRDEYNQREEDIEMLQQEMRDIENRHQQTIKHLEHENSLMTQKIQSLGDHMEDQEARMIRDQQMSQKQLEFVADKAQQERKDMQTKVEEAQKCATLADQELLSVKMHCQHLKNEADKRLDSVLESKQSFEAERQSFIKKVEDLRLRNQQISDQHLQQRLEEGREIALQKQRVEFQERKIDELNKQLEQTVCLYEDRIRLLKCEMQSDFQEQLQRLCQSKEQSESKFDAKRKAQKDKEATLQKQVLESERERAILDQQLASSQLNGKQAIQKLEVENQQQREQLQQISGSVFEIRDSLTSEIERLKLQLSDVEREYFEQQNNSERDKALMEGKVQFLEQQRDQAKTDYLEASHKFETTLEQIQRRGFFDKDLSESNSSALVSQLEAKIKKQVQDWGEEKQKMVSEHESTISRLAREKFQLDTDLQLLERDRQLLIKQQAKKLEELALKERELISELKALRNERELNSSQAYKQLERERQSQKQKIKDVEMRANETEIKKNALMFDFEKERAKWNQEKDQMKNRLIEHVEHIESLERAKETILKECEKLKNQQRKTTLIQTQRVMSNSKSGRYETLTPSSLGLESFKNSIFVGGPSKGFLGGRESNLGSQTGSQNDLDTPIMTLPFSKRDDNLLSLRVQREVTPEKPSLLATKTAAKKDNTSMTTPKAVMKDENKSMFTTKVAAKEEKSENMIATKAPGKIINFNMTRTKERLSNISNLLYKKPELD